MTMRKMVKIDEEKCNGCGLCIPSCKEGALQIVNGKAKLVSDIYCDGLGACLGECPQGAITIEERDAAEFDEKAVHERMEKMHPKKEVAPLPCGCPGSMAREINSTESHSSTTSNVDQRSELKNWPLQLMLVPPTAPYLKGADIALMADCTAFAYPNIHRDFIRNRVAIIACPKLDDTDLYITKLAEMIKLNNFRSIEVLMMEVPCCSGLGYLLDQAIAKAGSKLEPKHTTITLNGKILK